MSKPIPKSLHTVTVLAALARYLARGTPSMPVAPFVDAALNVLGYTDSPDTYELAAKARALLAKEAK